MAGIGLGAMPFLTGDALLAREPTRGRTSIWRARPRSVACVAQLHRPVPGELHRRVPGSLRRGARRVRRGRACLRRGDHPVNARDRRVGGVAEDLREAVRAHVVDPAHRFETVLGTVGFDANGDSIQQFVTLFRVDPLAAEGAGDWVEVKQQDYGVASE